MTYVFEIYRDAKNEWRFRLIAPNGRTIAVSGEGYKRRTSCLKTVRRIMEIAVTAAVKEKR